MCTLFKILSPLLLFLLLLTAALPAQESGYVIYGNFESGLGTAVDSAGDITGDGVPDVILGAPDDPANGLDAGSVLVVSGRSGIPRFQFFGDVGDRFGAAVSKAGDVNNDGFDDFLVGAPGQGTAGTVTLFSGADGAVIDVFDGAAEGAIGSAEFGSALAGGALMVGADSVPDIVVGAPGDNTSTGKIFVFSGIDGSKAFEFTPAVSGSRFGHAVAIGDSLHVGSSSKDIIVGAPLDNAGGAANGSVTLVSTTTQLSLGTFSGSLFEQCGTSVDNAGDVDNDGIDDIVYGCPIGQKVVVRSGIDPWPVLHTITGPAGTGFAVAGVGDWDTDNFDDIGLGIPFHVNINNRVGSARVVSGFDGVTLLENFEHDSEDSLFFGWSVSEAGDVDGDGQSDMIIGDPYYEANNVGGRVILFDVDVVDFFEPGTNESPAAWPGSPCEPRKSSVLENSVYLFSGEFHYSAEDIRIPGVGFDFVYARKHRSRNLVGTSGTTAQGFGWDFSMNLSVEEGPGQQTLELADGNTRLDTYVQQSSQVWTREEFFRTITYDMPTQVYSVNFVDGGIWEFVPMNSGIAPGKINLIRDRNLNEMNFIYDGAGRLERVSDTLNTINAPREVVLTYNADGFISTIADWGGRLWEYTYYQNGDSGGAFGDLKSVITPAVTNTVDFPLPAGAEHEFLMGKETVFTYSTGFSEDALNHNLLTITDPKGNLVLQNEYYPTTDPNDFEFDRIQRQIIGDPGNIYDYVYVEQLPSTGNNFAVVKTIVNDAVGNVTESFFDQRNRLVILREYTGRADPDLPTTEIDNRPLSKLRASDPDYFETRWQYNDDALPINIRHANGNTTDFVYESGINPTADRIIAGNLRRIVRSPGTHTPIGDQMSITEEFEYESGFGCCGSNFVNKHTDGRGNMTTHTYDSFGNRLQTVHRIPGIIEDFEYNSRGQLTKHTWPDNGNGHRREDVYEYYDDPASDLYQYGRLKNIIIDDANLKLTTSLEHNIVGDRIGVTDPRGSEWLQWINQLGQVTRSIAPTINLNGNATQYQTDIVYDANDNIIETRVDNLDQDGNPSADPVVNTHYTYDILNHMTLKSEDVDGVNMVDTSYDYDDNYDLIRISHGEAVNGNQPTNTIDYVLDERRLVYQIIRGLGGLDVSTTQYDYDRNRNLVLISEGLEETPKVTSQVYDAYDRLVTSIDPMGNTASRTYDPNGNIVNERLDGELNDTTTATGAVRLFEAATVFDAMDRATTRDEQFFKLLSQAPIGDGISTGVFTYSDNSQVISVLNDNLHSTDFTYDTANRLRTITDAEGNIVESSYDENSNLIQTMFTDISQKGAPQETFTQTYAYDELNRLLSQEDNIGNRVEYEYDSRGNLRTKREPRGNLVELEYDGLNRSTSTTYHLTQNGLGSGVSVGTIVTQNVWDESSRLIAQIDDNNHQTTYVYDSLDRVVQEIFADSTMRDIVYDVHDNPVEVTDANGTIQFNLFDQLDRLTSRTVFSFGGVGGATEEDYEYNGRSQIVRAENDFSLVEREHDSLGHRIEERLTVGVGPTQTTGTVNFLYDGEDNLVQLDYPGGRSIRYTHDLNERLQTVTDITGGSFAIADFSYIGMNRVEEKQLGANGRSEFFYDGDVNTGNSPQNFGWRKLKRLTYTDTNLSQLLDDRQYSWDSSQNRTVQQLDFPIRLRPKREFGHDSIHRLTTSAFAKTSNGMQVGAKQTRRYTYDGVQNRLSVAAMPGGSLPGVGTYTLDSGVPQDAEVNQYTTTPFESRFYDANGNLSLSNAIGMSTFFTYDYRDKMVVHFQTNGKQQNTVYDALGRRVLEQADVFSGSQEDTVYFYNDWNVIEEAETNTAMTKATYVYGEEVDQILNMQRNGSDYYYHCDDLRNIVLIADSSGAAVERYEYDDFGVPSFFDGAYASISASTIGNPYLWNARRWNEKTSLYYYRTRYMEPTVGRFTSRDSIGMWTDIVNLGNGYTFAGNRPWSANDPFGQFSGGCQAQFGRNKSRCNGNQQCLDEAYRELEDCLHRNNAGGDEDSLLKDDNCGRSESEFGYWDSLIRFREFNEFSWLQQNRIRSFRLMNPLHIEDFYDATGPFKVERMSVSPSLQGNEASYRETPQPHINRITVNAIVYSSLSQDQVCFKDGERPEIRR